MERLSLSDWDMRNLRRNHLEEGTRNAVPNFITWNVIFLYSKCFVSDILGMSWWYVVTRRWRREGKKVRKSSTNNKAKSLPEIWEFSSSSSGKKKNEPHQKLIKKKWGTTEHGDFVRRLLLNLWNNFFICFEIVVDYAVHWTWQRDRYCIFRSWLLRQYSSVETDVRNSLRILVLLFFESSYLMSTKTKTRNKYWRNQQNTNICK